MRNDKINVAILMKTDDWTFNNVVKPILSSIEKHENIYLIGSIVSEMDLWVDEITDTERISRMRERSEINE